MGKGRTYEEEQLQHYEELINQSILFAIDKTKEPTAYSNEAYKLTRNIASYLMLENPAGNEEFGQEIMETAISCVKAYDPSKGTPILHYCRAAWSKNKKRSYAAKEQFNNQGNVHYNKKRMQAVKKYMKLAEKDNKDCFSGAYVDYVADVLGRPKDEILDYMRLIRDGVAYADIAAEEGGDASLLDFDAARKFAAGYAEDDPEQLIRLEDFAEKIDQVFSSLQERQKGYIAGLITQRILSEDGISEKAIQAVIKYEFFDKEIYRRIMSNEKVTARTIAEEYGTTEQSISRGYREFLAKLKGIDL